jgi:cytochrome c peroxidase
VANRNTPSIQNVAYLPYFLSEGSVPTLEMQSQVPIQEANEFNHNILIISEKLNRIPAYVDLSMKAYGRLPDPFVISRSIASFERAILSGNSSYDLFLQDSLNNPLTENEKQGRTLFFSDKLNCTQCHNGFLFTNSSFQNNGLYLSYSDPGRFRFTKDSQDLARFKVPSLRNVAITTPYMHDGSIKTLEQVIRHYASGGKGHKNQSHYIQGFSIKENEIQALVSFLQSLTDNSFLHNKQLRF